MRKALFAFLSMLGVAAPQVAAQGGTPPPAKQEAAHNAAKAKAQTAATRTAAAQHKAAKSTANAQSRYSIEHGVKGSQSTAKTQAAHKAAKANAEAAAHKRRRRSTRPPRPARPRSTRPRRNRTPYGQRRPSFPFDWDVTSSAGAAGRYGSVNDLSRFLLKLRDDRTPSDEAWKHMWKDSLGWDRQKPGLAKGGDFGWESPPGSGEMHSEIAMYPDDVQAVLLINCATPRRPTGVLDEPGAAAVDDDGCLRIVQRTGCMDP